MSSGSKKGTQIYFFSFLSKVAAKEPLPGSPTGPLWTERDPFTGHVHLSQNPHKIPLNKMALRKKRPSMFPKCGAPTEADAHF